MSRRTLKNASAAALMAAGAGIAFAFGAPAQAAPDPCAQSYLGSQVFVSGFECISGDKIYSNFLIETEANTGTPGVFTTPGFESALTSAIVVITDNEPDHTIKFLATGSAFAPATYQFLYTVTIAPFAVATREFKELRTAATTSGTGNQVFTKTLCSLCGTGLVVTANQNSPGGVSPTGFYPGGIKSAPFRSTVIVSEGRLGSFEDTITQRLGVSTVPGPLPILGAGAAFGLSRKMRRRIKQTA